MRHAAAELITPSVSSWCAVKPSSSVIMLQTSGDHHKWPGRPPDERHRLLYVSSPHRRTRIAGSHGGSYHGNSGSHPCKQTWIFFCYFLCLPSPSSPSDNVSLGVDLTARREIIIHCWCVWEWHTVCHLQPIVPGAILCNYEHCVCVCVCVCVCMLEGISCCSGPNKNE